MASHLRRRWDAQFQGMSRRGRRGCFYDVYLADPIVGWDLSIRADTVESAGKLIGRSRARTTDAVNALAEAGVLRQRNVGKQRYRVFEATDVLDLFTDLERGLAGPTGRT